MRLVQNPLVKRALKTEAAGVDDLLSEWLDWKPISGRLKAVQRAARKKELLVAEADSRVVGFIHYVMHEDIIDGGPNAFISAFYDWEAERGKGVGTLLLEKATSDSLARGAVGVETSTIHMRARQRHQRHHFKQTRGDIGEAFLELDIAEYSQVRKRAGLTEN